MTEYVDRYTEIEKSFQLCKECGNKTGRRSEDQLYAPVRYYQDKLYETGPLCEECYETMLDCKKCKNKVGNIELSVKPTTVSNRKNRNKAMKTIILSGPMSSLTDKNKNAFDIAANTLRSLGHIVINPMQLVLPIGSTWGERLGRRLEAMRQCDEAYHNVLTQVPILAQLDGWQKSRGAMIEFLTAVEWNWTVCVAFHLIDELKEQKSSLTNL